MTKIYCASDLHIGYEKSNYPKIKEFFELVKEDADKLIICGDCYDLWRMPVEDIKDREPFKSTHEALLDLTKTIPVHIVFGNHDYNLSTMIDLPNITVTDDFEENGIFYCHGWRFDLQQREASKYYYWIVNFFPYLYQRYFKKPTEIINEEDKIYNSAKIYDEVQKFIDKNNYKYVIMGHSHNPIIKDKICDCGDFVDSISYILIKDGIPELKYLNR